MQIVIDLPEETYRKIKENIYDYGDMNVIIQNGTPLPKGHGRLIDADRLLQDICHDKREAFTKHQVWLKLSPYNQNAPTIIETDKGES